MALKNFDAMIDKYAELVVKVGLNIQPGQRLSINGKSFSRGVPLNGAPLVRAVAKYAYQAGASLVDVLWDDTETTLQRFKHAPRDSFEEYPSWRTKGLAENAKNGGALMTIYAEEPGIFDDFDPELVATAQRSMVQNMEPLSQLLSANHFNWCLVAMPTVGWAKKVYPDLSEEDALEALFETVFQLCRLDQEDPVAAWEAHIGTLHTRSQYLSEKQYSALRLTAPGTDVTLGMPPGHIWESARIVSQPGVPYVANMPTEEVFSMGHRSIADGTVTSTMPLSYGGTMIEDFSVTFKDGKVVDYKAGKNQKTLGDFIERDDGSSRVGEIALVPHSSPIAQSGKLFFNTLFDENAACHIALGRAYRTCLQGGETMSEEEFMAAGGNVSLEHVDFMIGSDQMDIDGITADGEAEPVMRKGEFAF
jgi:aminopeptidase